MGVERAVTRWYIQHQRITNEITTLAAKLTQAQRAERADIEKQLAALHTKLQALGPCPKPMMG